MHCTKIISRVCAAALSFILLLQAFPVSAINQAEADTSAALLELLSSGEEVFLTDDGEMLLEEEEMEEPSESYLSEDAPNAPEDDPDEEPLYEESALDLIPSGGKGPSVDLLDSELYATLSGKVVDEDGNGLSNVCVSLYDYGYEEIVALCYTDENGTWSTSSAVQGNEYHLRFHSPYFSFPLEGLVCKASGAAVTVETMTGTETYDPETPVSPAEDFSYTVLNATGISITGYLGTDVHVVIPETIDGYIVQAIDASAFSGNKALEAVILPAQVTTIGSSAFYGCNSLSYVGFNDKLTVIGSSAFYGCSALEDLDLPNTLQEIQNHAFYQCSSVSTLSMPMTLVGINGYAFAGCTGLKLVQIPDSVLGLGYRAFYQCTALETVTLPTEWTTCLAYSPNASVYYGHIFEGCSALSSLIVPETIVTLPDYALSGCSSLEEVLLPQSLKTIGMRAFYNCDSLASIVFPNSLNTVKQSAFQNCDSLSEVIFNASLKRLDAFAFAQCPSLSSAMLPDSVEALGYQLFCDDTALTAVHIPTGWTSCPAYSQGAFTGYGHIFDNCSALTSVTVSDGVTSLPDYAFQGCAELEEILLPESLQALPNYGFKGCSGLSEITIPSNVETIGAYALSACTGLSVLTIPDQVTSLGAGALEGCNALTEVSLSSSLTKIDRLAFSGCTGLTEIALPDSVESMGYQAFLNCTALQSINIPMSWNSCPAYSYGAFTGYSHIFEGCTALKSITVPEGFTQLPEYAFQGCDLLESIILPEGLESIPAHAFNGCSSLKSISLPQSVTAIGDYALRACSSLTELVIPNKVTSLGISAVENCSGLSEITLSSSLSSIERLALAGCTGLTELSIPNSVTSIGYRAFYNCSRLKDVTLSSDWNECPVYSHGAARDYGHIFEGCTALVRLDLPEGIVNLPAGALSYSPSLRTVTLPSTLVAIRDNAFKNCSALRGVWVDSGVDTISDSAFAGCSNLTIHGNQGSFAQTFATAHDIPFSTLPLSGDTDITLSGTVKDANGNALSGVSIMLYDISERYVFASVTTLEDGSWSIPNVTAGHDYRVRCHSANAVFDNPVTLNALYSSTEMNFTAKKTVSDTESAGSDFTYKITSGSFIQITGYSGSDTALVIPAVIDGYTVDSIAASVFQGNAALTSVVLPDTLTVIHESAFQNCTALAYVGFGSGLKTIYRSAFRGCSALSEVSLSNGVTYLEHWVFADCPALTSVSLPDTLASLGYQIFLNDTALTEINIPVGWNSCPSYSYGAFTGYSHLFENCTSLTSITIPEGLVVLPAHALDGCAQLQNVYLPSTLTTIGASALNRCTALTGITFPEKLETISESAFLGCTSFTSLHFPASLRTIYNFAFDACSGLTSITMDEGLDSLGAYAFRNCPALEKVQLADSITKLGHRAFQNCTALTEINIPVSWTTCPAYSQGAYTGYGAAFQGCTALKSVTVPEGIAALPAYAFANCESLEHIYLPEGIPDIPHHAFYKCTALKELKIPDTVELIGEAAMEGCTSLSSLVFPAGVHTLDCYALKNCSGLTSLTLSTDLETIGYFAMEGCSNLSSLVLPNKVSAIGYRAFYNCSRLSDIVLPSGWTRCITYSYGAFDGYGNIFDGCTSLTRLDVPDGVTTIPAYAFAGNTNLITVTLPDSIATIGNQAFNGCTNLGGVDLGNVHTIGDYAFQNCSTLEDLILSDDLRTIGKNAFKGCSALTIPNIPPRVTSIGEYAFYGTLLQDITIPSGVNSLNQYSFASCPDLNKVTIRRNVTSIHANAFKDSPNLYIICYNGSAAHTFAVNNNIPYELLPEPTPAGSDVDNGKAVPLTGTDSKGNPVNTRLFIYEYGTLDSLEGVTYSYEMGTLSMERDGYHSVNIPDCTLTMSKKVKVAMIPDSHKGNIFAVHCEGKDALANKVSIQKDSGLFSVNVYTDLPSSEIDVYQLMQDGSVLATSINGSFGLDAKKVIVDKEITARIILKDGTKCEKVKTNIVVMEKVPEWDGELSIGEKISFKIPKKVPLLGGGTFDIDFSVLPVNFTIKENNFRVGIGCTVDLLENEAQFASFRKFIESQQESIRTGLNGLSQVGKGLVSAGGKKGFDMEVFGYAEGTWTNSGDMQTVSGNIMIKITGSYKQEWQTMVVVVPVVLKLKLEAGAEALLGLGFDFENAQFFFNGKLTLTLPEITVSGGVGVAYIADISAYGSGKNEIEYSTELGSITATLSGEAGVSAKLLFASYKKALWKDDWVYYRVGEATPSLMDDMELLSLEEGDFQVDRSYVARQSQWLAHEPEVELLAATGVSTSQTLQTSIFYSAEPQLIVTDNGTKVLFWTGDDPERETGTNTAAMYSVYDSTAKTWSVPAIIEDDNSADFQLSAATDGEKIYLVWLDSSRKDLTADSTISEIAAANGISAAVYDPAEGTFNVTNVKDACCAMLPRITVVNGTPYIAWLENSSNDALTLTGTNTVCYASFDGSRWNEEVFATLSKPVISLAAGALNGQAAIAYTVDGDGDLANTLEDIELYAGAAGSAAHKITSNSVPEQNPQFAKVSGEDKLVWFADGSLCTTASFTDGTAMTGCDDISADYRVVSWQDETILLCAVGRSNSTQLQMYTLSDSVISKPVSLYNGDRYLSSFSVAQDGSNLLLPYTQVYANITSESIHETTDLCLMTVVPTYDLRLDSVTADPASIVGGGNLTAELTVTNTGTLPITQVTVTSTKLNVSPALNLLPGESGTITVSLPLSAVIASNAAYTFKAVVKNESNTADNTQTLVIGYADLSVQAEAARSAGMEKVLLTVDNLGCVDTLTTLRVRRNNESGEILKELHLGTLAAHSSEIFELDSTLVPEIGQQEQTLHFEVFAVANEEYYSNNTSFVYLTGGTPELAVDVAVNGTSYKVDTGLTGSCLTYAAVYDTNGKMLAVTGMSRLSSDSTAELTATVENLPATYEIRLFFLDDAYCPVLDMVTIASK